MDKNCIQLEMNFNGTDGNTFLSRLDSASFQILAEIPVPPAETKIADAVARYSDFEYAALDHNTSLSFVSETVTSTGTVDPLLFAMGVCRTGRDRHMIYLSGRDKTLKNLSEFSRVAQGEGFKNFCIVSGAPVAGENAQQTFRHHFTESVHTLERLRTDLGHSILIGCTVNPYKYEASDLCLQYYHLAKKIKFGASFAVTQYGWDMLKLQELRWYLTQRSFFIPTIARLLFLTPERAEAICTGKVPGVHISPDLKLLLENEMKFSYAQFEAAQIRRIQLHAAGARLLGYSGVQIAGINTVNQLDILLQRIQEAMEEFPDFDSWLSMYRQYYERLDMAPYPHHFYLFENLFSSSQPPENPVVCTADIPEPSMSEKFRLKIGESLFHHASEVDASERFLTKKILFSCKKCSLCRLPQTFYVCPETCPMHRANGPCSGSGADGECRFFSGKECIFLRQMRLANLCHDYPSLEERLIPDPTADQPE